MFKIFIISLLIIYNLNANYNSRLKDIVHLANVKYNIFTGYGLVVGLPGTDDKKSPLTQKSLKKILDKENINIKQNKLATHNSAVVSVTAKTFGFLEKGDLIDIAVASIGNAKSIEGGILLPTTLKSGNGEKYILTNEQIKRAKDNKNIGIVNLGGIVEKSFYKNEQANNLDFIQLSFRLDHLGIEHSLKIKETIEEKLETMAVTIENEKKIFIIKKDATNFKNNEILELLNLEIELDPKVQIIIDKETGILIIGSNVEINASHISLPFANISLNSAQKKRQGKRYTNVGELIEELNMLNVNINEIISIFTGLKKSGALNAQIIFQ